MVMLNVDITQAHGDLRAESGRVRSPQEVRNPHMTQLLSAGLLKHMRFQFQPVYVCIPDALFF